MPETTPRTETAPTPEFQKASTGLMLHIASGDFDATHTTQLNKAPTEIARKSFDALDAQHDKIRGQQQEKYNFIHKEILKKQNWPEDKIAPEVLRHFHMMHWAKTESGRIQDMFSHVNEVFKNNEAQRAEVHKTILSALTNLHILINDDTDVSNFADKLYQTTSNTSGIPGEFYNQFCTGDTNAKLLQALSEEEMMAIKPFLIDVLGSPDAYDALLATKQTQNALAAREDLSQGTTTVQQNEQNILHYFKQGEELLGARPSTPQPTVELQQKSPSPETLEESEGGSATEKSPNHAINEDSSFLSTSTLRGGVFDGASGHYRGDLASATAQKAVQGSLATLPPNATFEQTQEALVKAMQLANEQVLQIPFPKNERHPVTTGTIFQIWKGPDGQRKLIWVSIGDSRLWVRTANGDIHYLTRDDNPLKKAALNGRINGQEYNDIRRQIDSAQTQEDIDALGPNWDQATVTAMLGDKNATFQPGSIDLDPDEMVFLTTDGVHDNLSRQQIAEIAKQTSDPKKLADKLTAKAKEVSLSHAPRSKPDDITAVALSIGEFDKPISMRDTAEELLNNKTSGEAIRHRIDAILRDSQLREAIFNGKDFENMFIEAVSAPKGPDGTTLPTSANFSLIMVDGSESHLSANPAKGLHSGDRSIPLQESDGQNAKSLGRDSFWAVRKIVLRNPGQPEIVTYDRDQYLLEQPDMLQQVFTIENDRQLKIRQEEQTPQTQSTTESLEASTSAEDVTVQNIEKIIAGLRQPGIRRLGKEITFTNEEIQQMQTFTQEAQTLLDANPQLQDLLKTIKHYVTIDTGFSIAVGFAGTGIVVNPDITAPQVIKETPGQPMRIQVPPQLFTLYTAHNNARVISSILQQYQDTLTTGGTGTLGSFLAQNLEKTLNGYRQLKGLSQPQKSTTETANATAPKPEDNEEANIRSLFPHNPELQLLFGHYGIGMEIPNVLPRISKSSLATIIGFGAETTKTGENILVAILNISQDPNRPHIVSIAISDLRKKLDDKHFTPPQPIIPDIPQQLKAITANYPPLATTKIFPSGNANQYMQMKVTGYVLLPTTLPSGQTHYEPYIRVAQIPYKQEGTNMKPDGTGGTTTVMSPANFQTQFVPHV